MFNVKKVLVATLCVTMTFSLAACSVGKKKSKNLVSSQGEASSSKRGEYKSKVTKLADYKSLTIGESSVEVTDEFKANVKSTFLSSSTMNINTEHVGKADRAVETGDVVNIDYVGKIDGKEFDGGSAEGYNLQIGSSTFIDGFEDGLVGAKPGETKEVKLVLTKQMTAENTGNINNNAEIKEDYNVYGVADINSKAGNKVPEKQH